MSERNNSWVRNVTRPNDQKLANAALSILDNWSGGYKWPTYEQYVTSVGGADYWRARAFLHRLQRRQGFYDE